MGDYFQHLYSWYEALQLLAEESVYEYAVVEHPQAGSADDVTLHPKAGIQEPARYVQVKWHTDHRSSYSFDELIRFGPGEHSLLEKLFASWRKLPRDGAIEIWLVSNWVADPKSLGRYLRDSHCLSDGFLAASGRSAASKVRQRWFENLSPHDEDEFQAFCRDLRFFLGLSRPLLEKMVDDSMRGHGLRTGKNARDLATSEVADWIRLDSSPERITRDLILEAIRRRDLKALRIDEPKVCLWIHAWSRTSFSTLATVERDWTRYFDYNEKEIPSQEIWKQELQPDLLAASQEVSKNHQEKLVDIRGMSPMTYGLAIGSAFPTALGFTLRAEQRSSASNRTDLWCSDATPSELRFNLGPLAEETWRGDAPDILVILSVTVRAKPNFEELCRQEFFGPLKAAFLAEPTGGAAQSALRGERDACALAIDAKDLLQRLRNEHLARRIHLVPIAPAAFCLFLGQRLTGLGEIVTYERKKNDGYQQSILLEAG